MNSYENFEKDSYCTYDFRTKRSVSLMQKRILMQLRQVGPELADKLLEKFASVGGIINAADEDLMQVEGFGDIAMAQVNILRGGAPT